MLHGGMLDRRVNRVDIRTLVAASAIIMTQPVIAEGDYAIVPDPTITPGRARTTSVEEICANGTKALRHWSRDRDDRILQAYGLALGPHPDFEVDHLISLGIGGADTDDNLWPEPRRSLEPIWNAERKDRLEFRLRVLICGRSIGVEEAQRAIADDWVAAYRKYIDEPRQ
jgi:hypothetical protein